MKREVNHKELSELFYVYEHWLDGNLFYIGKGKDDRAFNLKRSKYWWNFVGEKMNDVEVKIIAYFVSEENALDFEENLIKKRVAEGAILANATYNLDVEFHFGNDVSEVFDKRNVELIEIVERGDMNKIYNNLKMRLKRKEKIVLFVNSNISVLEKFVEIDENV